MNKDLLLDHKTNSTPASSVTSRNYGIDLLRIVSMLMICVVHIMGDGGLIDKTVNFDGYMSGYWLLIACLPCVNCYALISGYVGINAKHRMSSLIKLWMTVFFYSVGITLVYMIFCPGTVTLKVLLKSGLPAIFNMYWYFTAYFLLFFFLPLINKGISLLSKREHRNLVIALFVLFSCVNSFMLQFGHDIFRLAKGYSVWWLLIMYITGAYLKRCGNMIITGHQRVKWLCVFVSCVILTWSAKFVFLSLGYETFSDMLISYTSPTIYLSAVSLVMIFSGLRIKGTSVKVIKFLVPLCFSVYLIHVQDIFWTNTFKKLFAPLAGSPAVAIPLIAIGLAVLIYIICTIIDIGRFYLFKVLRINVLSERIESLITRICEFMIKKFIPGISHDDGNDD